MITEAIRQLRLWLRHARQATCPHDWEHEQTINMIGEGMIRRYRCRYCHLGRMDTF